MSRRANAQLPLKYECVVCSKRYALRASCVRHTNRVHPRPYDPTQYPVVADRPRSWTPASDEKLPHKCPICGALFGVNELLSHHIRLAHLKS